MASITVEKFIHPYSKNPLLHLAVYPLKLVATSTDMDAGIFLFRVDTRIGNLNKHQFCGIADVFQLGEIGLETFNINSELNSSYYRTSSLELFFTTLSELEEVYSDILRDIKKLVTIWNSMGQLKSTSTNIIGDLDSAFILETSGRVETVDDAGVSVAIPKKDILQLHINYEPAGVATYVDGLQGVTEETVLIRGWITSKNPTYAFEYQPQVDVSDHIAASDSYQVVLTYNGITMPRGVVWDIVDKKLYWMDYSTTVLENLPTHNAPWPVDYLDAENRGSSIPRIELTLVKKIYA